MTLITYLQNLVLFLRILSSMSSTVCTHWIATESTISLIFYQKSRELTCTAVTCIQIRKILLRKDFAELWSILCTIVIFLWFSHKLIIISYTIIIKRFSLSYIFLLILHTKFSVIYSSGIILLKFIYYRYLLWIKNKATQRLDVVFRRGTRGFAKLKCYLLYNIT